MTNKQIAVIGKVAQGRMTTVVVAGNRMVGSIRPIEKAAKPVTPSYTPPVPQAVYVYEPIDSPFIRIVQENHIKLKQEKEALAKENIRNRRIHSFMNFFNRK